MAFDVACLLMLVLAFIASHAAAAALFYQIGKGVAIKGNKK
jgi:di/tricarboxylate transporter